MDFGEWKNQNDEADLEKRLLKIRNESKKKHKLDEINQSGCLESLLGEFFQNTVVHGWTVFYGCWLYR